METNLIENPDKNFSIEVGQTAPNFTLLDESGKNWSLSDQKGSVTVLLFYPKNETLVCTRQLCSVRDNWSKYLATKALIVGVSPGTPDEHRSFAGKYNFPIPLLADSDRKITRLYCRHFLFPISFLRAVFVIDAKGFIRYRKIMLRAFRPTDEQILTEIYAARIEVIYETYERIKGIYRTGGNINRI